MFERKKEFPYSTDPSNPEALTYEFKDGETDLHIMEDWEKTAVFRATGKRGAVVPKNLRNLLSIIRKPYYTNDPGTEPFSKSNDRLYVAPLRVDSGNNTGWNLAEFDVSDYVFLAGNADIGSYVQDNEQGGGVFAVGNAHYMRVEDDKRNSELPPGSEVRLIQYKNGTKLVKDKPAESVLMEGGKPEDSVKYAVNISKCEFDNTTKTFITKNALRQGCSFGAKRNECESLDIGVKSGKPIQAFYGHSFTVKDTYGDKVDKVKLESLLKEIEQLRNSSTISEGDESHPAYGFFGKHTYFKSPGPDLDASIKAKLELCVLDEKDPLTGRYPDGDKPKYTYNFTSEKAYNSSTDDLVLTGKDGIGLPSKVVIKPGERFIASQPLDKVISGSWTSSLSVEKGYTIEFKKNDFEHESVWNRVEVHIKTFDKIEDKSKNKLTFVASTGNARFPRKSNPDAQELRHRFSEHSWLERMPRVYSQLMPRGNENGKKDLDIQDKSNSKIFQGTYYNQGMPEGTRIELVKKSVEATAANVYEMRVFVPPILRLDHEEGIDEVFDELNNKFFYTRREDRPVGFYKRKSQISNSESHSQISETLFDLLTHSWHADGTSTGSSENGEKLPNRPGIDFDIYSTERDAYYGLNPWKPCTNFSLASGETDNVGFPGAFCGPNGYEGKSSKKPNLFLINNTKTQCVQRNKENGLLENSGRQSGEDQYRKRNYGDLTLSIKDRRRKCREFKSTAEDRIL